MRTFTLLLMSFMLLSTYGISQSEDHKEMIEGEFTTPQEITAACLSCHEETGADIQKTRHWNWLGEEFELPGHGRTRFGKQNMINNFCVAVPSNLPRCTSCHIGYGWKDDTFDFNNPNNIDCLICHDQTGTYKKIPTAAGMPFAGIDLLAVAQSVGTPTRANCGICHFDGGGDNGVKHGDLDNSLIEPTKELDVHMGGSAFTCTECHRVEKHNIMGASHGSMAQGVNHISCLDCHDVAPHEKEQLNNHVQAIACETCHIPTYGRGNPTKVWWDWSTAGQDIEVSKDEYGMPVYDKKKGSFKWDKNVQPEYRWYNGSAVYYQIGDKIESVDRLSLNRLNGSITDSDARIYPFKVMRGKQMYDAVNKYLIIPNLFGENGYWKKWDWETAYQVGMKAVNLDYSGSSDFIETELFIPVHHMVAPKEQSLACKDCHNKTEGIMDWQALGYTGDPNKEGGREKNGMVK